MKTQIMTSLIALTLFTAGFSTAYAQDTAPTKEVPAQKAKKPIRKQLRKVKKTDVKGPATTGQGISEKKAAQ